MPQTGLVLAFYRDHEAAQKTLETLRQRGFQKTATLQQLNNKKFDHNRGGLPSGSGAVLGGLGGLLLSRFLPLPSGVRMANSVVAPALSTLAGAGIGHLAARQLAPALPAATIRNQEKWLLRGETMVIAQGNAHMLARIVEIIRESDNPSVYILREGLETPPQEDSDWDNAELNTADQLRDAARKLAHEQQSVRMPDRSWMKMAFAAHHRLIGRVRENERVILEANNYLALAVRLNLPVSIAAEWLLDNAYVIEGQIKDALKNLSPQFYADLPILPPESGNTHAGMPRVYAIAVELMHRTDSRLDKFNISDWINAYQRETPLTMSELWAFPLMLRIAIVENLRNLSVRVTERQRNREQASVWANRLLNSAHHDPSQLPRLLANLAQEQQNPAPHFADRLIGNLYDEESALLPARSWIESTLNASLREIVQEDQHRQAIEQISVANCVTSLRHLANMDWRTMFESLSLLESELRGDPAGVYARMDFQTRDHYRHQIERLARGSKLPELEVARRVVELGNQTDVDAPGLGLRRHIGYFLADEGQSELEELLNHQAPLAAKINRFIHRNSTPLYLGSIATGTIGALLIAARLARRSGGTFSWPFILFGALPASEVSVQIINYLVTRTAGSQPLPKMNFEGGVPDEARTLVVVPTLLLSEDSIADDVQQLEIHYLANSDANLRFALLGDFPDAPQQHTPDDRALLEAAQRGITELNARYGTPGDRFFLFHRSRIWSESEGRWMGRERKRGKLEELNAYLKGEASDSPDHTHPVSGDSSQLAGIKFVITLDADTQMPHDAARRLIETLAHPLNRPVIGGALRGSQSNESALRGLVRRGYTIIQPGVSTTLPSATATQFSRWFSDNIGLDPYTHVRADVYQDLFHEGSYHGKGIYDLDAFHEVLKGRFPAATLLSHDLLEGAHVRVGLASDIELLDDFPATYLAFAKRAHRWIRGDWQIMDWISNYVPSGVTKEPGEFGARTRNPLSTRNRWKVFDNLRRSLLPPATVAFLIGGWLVSPGTALTVSILVGVTFLWPFISGLITWGTTDTTNPEKVARMRQEITSLLPNLMRGLLNGALLPHQAAVSLDAIGRVLYRRLVSHRLMLEWETARVAGQTSAQRERQFLLRLLGGLGFSALVTVAVRFANPAGFLYAAPFLISWSSLPLIVKWLNTPYLAPSAPLADNDRVFLRQIARQTWRYFDDFVGPQTNWLAPDNYQERLRVEIAQRTSPTNIGMWLLAVISANDFGYVTTDDAIGRLLPTLRTLETLERYHGHLLNWYEIQRMEALRPRYVSVVDSGNLLGCLLTLVESTDDLTSTPVLDNKALSGLRDTLSLLREALNNENGNLPSDAALESDLANLQSHWDTALVSPIKIIERLRQAQDVASRVMRKVSSLRPPATQRQSTDLATVTSDPRFASDTAAYWAAQLETQLEAWLHIGQRYLHWQEKLASAPDSWLWPLGEDAPALRREILNSAPSLKELSTGNLPVFKELMQRRASAALSPEISQWLQIVEDEFNRSRWLAGEIMADAAELTNRAGKLADEMDFRFLYDAERKLFPIGFNLEEMRLDSSYYDLLASECRLASFLAVARSEVPVEHWLNLGRRFGIAPDGSTVLLSWSGTMFEYLMPLIFTPNSENSLLDWACKTAVRQQMAYGKARGVPWGISEAAFSALDAQKTYQYKAFGAPVLGLKRGLEDELVVAPYASAMALMVAPQEALKNLKRLESMGMRGDYGFYESIDFKHLELGDETIVSPDRSQSRRGVIVRTFMVHHQGMSLLALNNVLNNNILQERFSRQPAARATMPLLHERIPIAPTILDESVREAPPKPISAVITSSLQDRLSSPNTPCPRVNLLSNGNMAVMTTNAGGGYLRWKEFEITRWRADTTRDQWGSFIYIRDLESGIKWSAAHQPLRRPARYSSVSFKPEKTEYHRRDNDIETKLHVCVSPEDDAEIRLLQLSNLSSGPRILEVTSFMEVCLAPHNADRAHPAFSKLFVQTESALEGAALLATRRLRSPHDTPIWGGHVLATPVNGARSFETDRLKFLGRNRTSEDPQGLNGDLSNTAGAVLDPCFSLRQRIVLAAGQRIDLAFTTVVANSREAVLQLAEKYRETAAAQRALDLAWTHAQLEMHHLGLDEDALQQFQHLASYMLYPFDALRAPAKRLRENQRGQSGLWAFGISGDLPIMVLNVADERDLPAVREVMLAHAFWRMRGFKTDLVILNEAASGYNQDLNEGLRRAAIAVSPQTPHEQLFDQPGGIFMRANDQLSAEDLTLLLAVARAILVAARGSLAQQLSRTPALPEAPKNLQKRNIPEQPSAPLPFLALEYFNSLGGFTPDGKEYAIYLSPGTQTPLPWVNVFASPLFGSVVSESGRGFSWYGNSQSNRLTPWSNDPVSEGAADSIYIRDEETGVFWTPTPTPVREQDPYRARHGQGYTVFEHNSHAIEQELTLFVPVDGAMGENSPPVRVARLKLKNASSRKRRLRVTQFTDWVLGTTREEMQMHIVTQWDAAEKILLARNHYRPDFSNRIAFASASPLPRSWSSDRTSFLGRNGSPQRPLAMEKEHLDERTGAGFDCCSAIQVMIDLAPDEVTEVIFLLGEANDIQEARHLVRRFRKPEEVERALRQTQSWWDDFLGSLQVQTPILGVNFLLNRWLPYQSLSCRVWGRSAWYQSGGAFGFRDQLQDVMAFMHSRPQLAREQILRAAAHQFEEGDVQHWWHPPSDAGVRTRFADDLLWMPYVTAHYIATSGDASILDEIVGFLKGEPLAEDEHEVYNRPQISEQSATLFEHCRRAIEKGCTYGPHQLPLIGTGDWNDGLNRVGVNGKGESVWMAWFLCDVLNKFADLCEARGEGGLATDFRQRAKAYANSTEEQAWDGQWYLRAFFDDGSPMGAKGNLEAQIDSLPQSWAILTGCADKERAGQALQAAYEHLVLHDKEMILLFTPAFDKTDQDPGYIKGYLPGVRENGGQYTHAATWLALAFAEKGDGDTAVQLLQMLNPIEHAKTPQETETYKVEPYAIVADVYNLPGHIGRGGWTWYTGSASWVYRVWVEGVLGFKLRGDSLEINPAIPKDWPSFSMTYRHKSSTYEIRVENPHGIGHGVASIEVNSAAVDVIQLVDDGQTHQVLIHLGSPPSLHGSAMEAVTMESRK